MTVFSCPPELAPDPGDGHVYYLWVESGQKIGGKVSRLRRPMPREAGLFRREGSKEDPEEAGGGGGGHLGCGGLRAGSELGFQRWSLSGDKGGVAEQVAGGGPAALGSTVQNSLEGEGPWENGGRPEVPRLCVLKLKNISCL